MHRYVVTGTKGKNMSAATKPGHILKSSSSEEIVHEWLRDTDTERRLHACIDVAIQNLNNDLELIVPRTQEARANGFAQWLSFWDERLRPAIQEEFARQFPRRYVLLSTDFATQIVSEQVWPSIREFLLAFAIRGLTRSWVTRKIGDAVLVGEPEHENCSWTVPLFLKDRPGIIGSVVLDENGNIDEKHTVTRAELLARICSGD